jgi:peptidoglycan DL-endopeptidase CwlO
MSLSDVMSRIQQLQQLVDPNSASTGSATTADGQDFQSMFASVTGGTGTDASADPAATTTASAYGTTGSGLTGSAAAGTTAATDTGLSAMTAMTAPTAMTAQTAATNSAPTAAAVTGNDIVADSIQYLGVPYKWGGTDPQTGLDCSGLVQKVFADKGVALPRTSAEQATVGTEVPGGVANAQPGDLVFFGSPVHHVGIYAGNNMMVEAPHTGTQVQVHSIDGSPTHVRRVSLTPATAAVTATSTTSGLLGSQAIAASTTGTSTTTSAATTLASLSATDPQAAMDALGVPASLRAVLSSAAQSQNLPVSLLAAVAKVESSFNVSSVSSAGAQGLMQLMPDTAAGIGANPWDPQSAANGAAKLLRGYINQYNSVPLALAAYNAGPGAVAKYNGIPPYAETQAYVTRVGDLAAAA